MKLAPLSIPYRAVQKAASLLFAVFFIGTAGAIGSEIAILLGLLAAGGALAYEVAYYRRFEYELTEDTLDIGSGVISRRDREIPYARLQNVDVSRNVIQRALGLAAVDLETAGGSSTEGSIRYVTADEATRIQREVQRRKSRAGERSKGVAGDTDAAEDTGEPTGPTETKLFSIATSELALVGALSFDPRLLGLVALLASGSFPVLSGFMPGTPALFLSIAGLFLAGALIVASWLLGAVLAISNYYGFRLVRAGDELRYERGLFRRYSGSIPTEKVQTLSITDNPAKRLFGFATLTIETAGYAPGQGGSYGSQAAVPLARTQRVHDLAREVESFGDPEFTRPPSRIRIRYAFQYTMAVLAFTGLVYAVEWFFAFGVPWYAALALLVLAPIAGHYKWKHRGYWLGEDHLLTRVGYWKRQTTIVPYYRVQTVIDTRTVFQRRWDVATLIADTAGTGSLVGRNAAAIDIATTEADDVRHELADRLQASLVDRRERTWGDRSIVDVEPRDDAEAKLTEDGAEGSAEAEPAEDRAEDSAEAEPAEDRAEDSAEAEPAEDRAEDSAEAEPTGDNAEATPTDVGGYEEPADTATDDDSEFEWFDTDSSDSSDLPDSSDFSDSSNSSDSSDSSDSSNYSKNPESSREDRPSDPETDL